MWAWGDNFSGELGDGTTTNRLTPVQVVGLSGVTGIAAGSFANAGGVFGLALLPDGTLRAWGATAPGIAGQHRLPHGNPATPDGSEFFLDAAVTRPQSFQFALVVWGCKGSGGDFEPDHGERDHGGLADLDHRWPVQRERRARIRAQAGR